VTDEFGVDLDEVMRVVDTAEALIIRFVLIEKRLLMDTRRDDQEGPLLALVPRAGSLEVRVLHLKELRPRFPVPSQMMSFLWPRGAAALRASGVWQRIVDRLAQSGPPGMAERCEQVFDQILQDERAETMKAVRGEGGYYSLWEGPRSSKPGQ